MTGQPDLLAIMSGLAVIPPGIASPLDPTAEFTAIGIDSLRLLKLIRFLEQQTGVEIPDEEIGRLKTIGDVQELFARLTANTTTNEQD